MKKIIFSFIILSMIVSSLGYYIFKAKIQRENLEKINQNLEVLTLLNKDFDLYLENSITYQNFDIINNKIFLFKKTLYKINQNKVLKQTANNKILTQLKSLNNSINLKFNYIMKGNAYRAVLNNSFRLAQKLYKNNTLKKYNSIYTTIMTIDKNPEINILDEIKLLNNISAKKHNNKYFIKHSKIILDYQLKIIALNKKLNDLNIADKLSILDSTYTIYATNIMKQAEIAIAIVFILLVIFLILFFIYDYKFNLSSKELYKFKRVVENSDNIVIITNKHRKITYVNHAFTKITGYKYDDVIGKTPKLLQSNQNDSDFYKKLHKVIYSGKTWKGQFINSSKNGDLIYEKAFITPIFENGEIIEFVSIKLDITNEVKAQNELKEKEQQLMQQSKMAAMGEMLENIAHQWRQPLSIISTLSTGSLMQRELGLEVPEEENIKTLTKINDTAQYLSETINNFRDFFKVDKEKEHFNLKETYQKTLNLVNSKFESLHIEVIENLKDIDLYNLNNEVVQVIMNLLNNAKDILETTKGQKRLIFVNIYETKDFAILEVKDNAGGIPKNIINKVFEPYFTTKHQSQGTGIGLYMSEEIMVKHLKGSLSVKNDTFKYDNHTYIGAKFTIKIPKD